MSIELPPCPPKSDCWVCCCWGGAWPENIPPAAAPPGLPPKTDDPGAADAALPPPKMEDPGAAAAEEGPVELPPPNKDVPPKAEGCAAEAFPPNIPEDDDGEVAAEADCRGFITQLSLAGLDSDLYHKFVQNLVENPFKFDNIRSKYESLTD